MWIKSLFNLSNEKFNAFVSLIIGLLGRGVWGEGVKGILIKGITERLLKYLKM